MMKQTVIGSKFISFMYNSEIYRQVFPYVLHDKPHLKKRSFDISYRESRTVEVEIVVLQVETHIVGDKLYYLVEYIEKE